MSENILHDEMEQILKRELRSLALKTRSELGLTQRQMSDRYVMAESSYSALESGENMCGTLTTIFLLSDQIDPYQTLKTLIHKLDKLREGELTVT